ncbi:MAG: DciA family protein [Alphaproteobacteria bacterium]
MQAMRTRKRQPAQVPPEIHPRRGKPVPVAEDVLAQASALLERAGFSDPTLLLRWPEIAGTDVARVARPSRLQEGPDGATLTVTVEAGAAVFLQHQTRALLERLNGFLGPRRITRVRIVPGQLERTAGPPPHPFPGARQTSQTALERTLQVSLKRLGNLRAAACTKRGLPD